jgi:hypothetical protein
VPKQLNAHKLTDDGRLALREEKLVDGIAGGLAAVKR